MSQIRIPLILSFYTLIFLGLPKYGNFFQIISLSFILLQNVLTFISLKRAKINTFKNSLSPFSMLLIVLVPLLSLINNLFNPELYYVEYSILFFVIIFSIYIAINTIDFQVIFKSFVCAGVAITATILVASTNELSQALTMNIDPETGLSRFSPFGLHPNLVGHIFGGLAVTFFCCMLYGQKILHKIFFALLVGISYMFCIAASSRGGFIASSLGVITIYAFAIWQDKTKRNYFFLFLVLAILSLFLFQGIDKIIGYMSSIMEFNTADRGVNSGLTGRTGGWDKLITTMTSSISSLLFGNGLRSGGPEVLGYAIDNGYLNMFYESGLAVTAIFVMFMIYNVNKLRKSLLKVPSIIKAVALGLFVFILFESIVARYLLSIGNPTSLFVVFCILGLKNIFRSVSGLQRMTQPDLYRFRPQSYR